MTPIEGQAHQITSGVIIRRGVIIQTLKWCVSVTKFTSFPLNVMFRDRHWYLMSYRTFNHSLPWASVRGEQGDE